MALDKVALTNDILGIREKVKGISDPDEASREYAKALAEAIEKFVKSGEVSFQQNTVTGVCPSGGGPLSLGSASKGKVS